MDHKISIGIELGSTRIKGVAIEANGSVIGSANFDWENNFLDGFWTYDLELMWYGVQTVFSKLKDSIRESKLSIDNISNIGFSAMMHGYLPFGSDNQLLVPFRTWRNSTTQEASDKLTDLLGVNIPLRWSIAHYYQAILDGEEHVKEIDFVTTLAGYVSWKLTGSKKLGYGDLSGMFPIDKNGDFDLKSMNTFNDLVSKLNGVKTVKTVFPVPAEVGKPIGTINEEGLRLLDPSGELKHSIFVSPSEGDAGTGMIATNSIKPKSGNVSAGTSAFAMLVLEKPLTNLYREIDVVTTPDGEPVAMIHSNNCTSEINEWMNLFEDLLKMFDLNISKSDIFEKVFNSTENASLEGYVSYGFHSGENILDLNTGVPVTIRSSKVGLNPASLIKSQLYSAFAPLHIGMKILEKEGLNLEVLNAHGGVFNTPVIAQKILSSALSVPISVSKISGEGGAWGMAILANYLNYSEEYSLQQYLEKVVFKDLETSVLNAGPEEISDYNLYIEKYLEYFEVEKTASRIVG